MGVKTIDLNANFFSFFLYIFWFLFYIFMAIATRKIYSPYERDGEIQAFIVRINDCYNIALEKKWSSRRRHECDSSTHKKTDIRIEAKKKKQFYCYSLKELALLYSLKH